MMLTVRKVLFVCACRTARISSEFGETATTVGIAQRSRLRVENLDVRGNFHHIFIGDVRSSNRKILCLGVLYVNTGRQFEDPFAKRM